MCQDDGERLDPFQMAKPVGTAVKHGAIAAVPEQKGLCRRWSLERMEIRPRVPSNVNRSVLTAMTPS